MQEKCKNGESGFTLVELAVVMIIVGLLIGGILKGAELITNAQVASTVSQIKSLEAATSTFRDSYRAFPGDMTNTSTRLPNCASAPCSTGGDGNGRISNAATADAATDEEGLFFFTHLSAADLISGVDGSDDLSFGRGLPSAPAGGGFYIGFHTSGALGANASARGGHYLSLRDASTAPTAGTGALEAAVAQRIDDKVDDGSPLSGSVFSAHGSNCEGDDGSGGGTGVYDTANNPRGCNLYIRIQG